MANKYIVALMVVCLLNVVIVIKAEEDLKTRQDKCFNYCYNACIFPSKFCKWGFGKGCHNPIGMDAKSNRYPVLTEEDYKSYMENEKNDPAQPKYWDY